MFEWNIRKKEKISIYKEKSQNRSIAKTLQRKEITGKKKKISIYKEKSQNRWISVFFLNYPVIGTANDI